MIFKAKNRIPTYILLLIVLPVPFFANVPIAKADILSELTSGVATFVRFVSQSVTGMRSDFCDQYTSGQSNFTPFEMNFGKNICTGYVSPSSVLSGRNASSTPNDFSIFSIPGVIMPNAVPNVTDGSAGDTFSNSSNSNNTPAATIKITPSTASTTTTTDIPTTTLPGGLSGDTSQNGVSLNDSQIIYWTNIARNNNGGLSQLKENTVLDTIAEIRIKDMFAKQYFDHYSPTGDNVSKEADANGYSYITIGENIALGNFGSSHDLVTAWMNSPGHRANILNTSYTEIGVAAEQGMYNGSQVWIAGQMFGKPLASCPGPDASIKQKISDDTVLVTNLNTSLASAKAQLTAIGTSDQSAYNAEATVYNNLATQYNNLVAEMKTLTNQYNQQVAVFNNCIK